jgi:very-short-patch-repair endonuclease
VLSALTSKICESRDYINAQNLQGMTSGIDEVPSVLVTFTPKIRECKEHLNKQDVDILKFILAVRCETKHDKTVSGLFEVLNQISTENACSFFFNTQLADVNKRRQSKGEVRYQKLASKAFDGMLTVKTSYNECLFGYEADIVLRMGSDVINVEVDGIQHKQAVKKRFCGWRDRYLSEKHGIIVKRIDLMSHEERSLTDQDIIERFRSCV